MKTTAFRSVCAAQTIWACQVLSSIDPAIIGVRRVASWCQKCRPVQGKVTGLDCWHPMRESVACGTTWVRGCPKSPAQAPVQRRLTGRADVRWGGCHRCGGTKTCFQHLCRITSCSWCGNADYGNAAVRTMKRDGHASPAEPILFGLHRCALVTCLSQDALKLECGSGGMGSRSQQSSARHLLYKIRSARKHEVSSGRVGKGRQAPKILPPGLGES